MKFQYLVLLALIACSSVKNEEANTEAPKNISSDSFKKEKPLKNSDIQDYYSQNPQSLSPALQDETLDRYSVDELAALADNKDPLIEISLRCSKQDFKEAFQVASKNFLRYQKVAPYWNLVANCHLNQGSQRKALLFYNKALEITPNYVPALNNIGVMYSRMGQDQKALVAFEQANKFSKFAKTPRYNLAKLYLRYGLAEAALPIFQSLLNNSPSDADLLNAVGSSKFLLSDYPGALQSFEQIPQSEWKRAEVGLNVAVTLSKMNKKADAKKVFSDIEKPKANELKRYYSSVGKELGE
jgi:tetratricopeptide (TPR) repeat protein